MLPSSLRICVVAVAGLLLATPALSHAGAPTAMPRQNVDRHAGRLVAWDVRDGDTGKPIPCKLTFIPCSST
jgi:hypothetical protein